MTAAAALASEGETRAMLKSLGKRPGREAVEQARQAMARIDALQSEKWRSVALGPPPPGVVDVTEWRASQEIGLREAAEKEKIPYKSVILLDELHQAYEDGESEHEEKALDGKKLESKVAPLSTNDAETAQLLQDALASKKDKLDLSNRLLSHIPESVGKIVTLVSLDLSNNQLQSLPDSLTDLVNLEALKVNSNQLKTLPDSIGQLTKLKYLDVSSNTLQQLPESLGRCSSLLEINASFNHLEFIPQSFGLMLVCLEKLELHLNQLRSIPAAVCQIKSLTYLDLHMNKMKCLPSVIGHLTQLEYLDMSSNFNDLVSVPESVGYLVSLTHCDLSYNQIKELPDSVGKLEKLQTLKLEGNPLVVPPMEVVEHSHDAVMEYLHQRYVNSTVGDLSVSASSKTLLYKGKNDYNPWVPACAGNSPLAAWVGSICGNMGNVLSGGTGEFLGFQEFHKDEIVQKL